MSDIIINQTEDTVTISRKYYEKLIDGQAFLECLKSCGVDNWIGYGDAQEMFDDI